MGTIASEDRPTRGSMPRRLRSATAAGVGAVLVLGLVAGCSSSGGDEGAESTATTEAGCAKPAAAGRTERTITVDGLERNYILYVPESYDGSTTALVVNLHGSGSNADEQLDGSELAGVADEHGFVVVAPDAGVTRTVGGDGPTGGVWTVPGVPYVDGTEVDPNAPDDVRFLDALVDEVSAELCIDVVAATGTSGGGRMASALGCFSDRFDVIAPVAGLRLSEDCTPMQAVDIVAFHGTEDKVNPYPGGGPASWGPTSVPDAAAEWAALQQCTKGPERTEVSASVQLDTWTGCTDGVDVRLYTVTGGGHNWPGGRDAAADRPEFAAIVGVTTQEIDAGQLLWERIEAQQAS